MSSFLSNRNSDHSDVIRRLGSPLGFTLIELLITIAIISVISAVVFIAISSVKERFQDATVKAGIRQIRTIADNFYDSNNLSFIGFDTCITNPTQDTCKEPIAAQSLNALIADIKNANGMTGDLTIFVNQESYCLSAPLRTDPTIHVCAQTKDTVSTQQDQSQECTYDLTSGPTCVSIDDPPPVPVPPATLIPNTPADNATEVPQNTTLIIDFSKNVTIQEGKQIHIINDTLSQEDDTITLTSGGVSGDGTQQIEAYPTQDLTTNTDYHIEIDQGAFRDADGLLLPGITNATDWNFKTQVPPQLTGTAPTGGSEPITTDLSMTFANPVTRVPGNYVRVKKTASPTEEVLTDIMSGTNVGNTVTVNPPSNLAYSTQYYVNIDAGALQDAGNSLAYEGLSDTTTWTFGTAAYPAKIYFADMGWIKRANLDGSSVETLVSAGSYLRHIALDKASNKMYWTDWGEIGAGRIRRANLDGSNVENVVTGIYYLYSGIDIDAGAGKMYWGYWPGGLNNDRLNRSNLDGSNVELLVSRDDRYRDIELDLTNGKIYWGSDAGWVSRSNLDGSNVENVLTGLGYQVHDIALDVSAGKVYWRFGGNAHYIQRANLDGSNIEDVITDLGPGDDFDLDVSAGKIYYSSADKIYKANLDGSNKQIVLSIDGTEVMSIALDL